MTKYEKYIENSQGIIDFENDFKKRISEKYKDRAVVEFPYQNTTIHIYTKNLKAKMYSELYPSEVRSTSVNIDDLQTFLKECEDEKKIIKEVSEIYIDYKKEG